MSSSTHDVNLILKAREREVIRMQNEVLQLRALLHTLRLRNLTIGGDLAPKGGQS